MSLQIDGAGRVKGQEVSLWELNIDPRHHYHVVPHTMRRGQEGEAVSQRKRREEKRRRDLQLLRDFLPPSLPLSPSFFYFLRCNLRCSYEELKCRTLLN